MTVVAICDPSDTTVAAFAGPAGAWLRRPTDLEPALWEQDPQYKQYQYIYIYIVFFMPTQLQHGFPSTESTTRQDEPEMESARQFLL